MAESAAAWVEVTGDHWQLVRGGDQIGKVWLRSDGGWRWWTATGPIGSIYQLGVQPSREQAMQSAELAVRLWVAGR